MYFKSTVGGKNLPKGIVQLLLFRIIYFPKWFSLKGFAFKFLTEGLKTKRQEGYVHF